MKDWRYEKGLHKIGDGIFAWLQPAGDWGWSNAGLICGNKDTLLVDTLFDLKLTREMLDAMRKAGPPPKTVVNTHANGDHCYGNAAVKGAEIISSVASAQEMAELPPSKMGLLLKVASVAQHLGPLGRAASIVGLHKVANLVQAAPFVLRIFSHFDVADIELTLPTRTFEGRLELQISQKRVELIELGPAHTKGDVIAWLPDDRVVFTGDILFMGGHPIVWEGPIAGWVDACEKIIALDPEIVVPGHGPITDVSGVQRMLKYLKTLDREAQARFKAGMSVEEAARDIDLSEFSDWSESERVFVNVHTVYRTMRNQAEQGDVFELFAGMAKLNSV